MTPAESTDVPVAMAEEGGYRPHDSHGSSDEESNAPQKESKEYAQYMGGEFWSQRIGHDSTRPFEHVPQEGVDVAAVQEAEGYVHHNCDGIAQRAEDTAYRPFGTS